MQNERIQQLNAVRIKLNDAGFQSKSALQPWLRQAVLIGEKANIWEPLGTPRIPSSSKPESSFTGWFNLKLCISACRFERLHACGALRRVGKRQGSLIPSKTRSVNRFLECSCGSFCSSRLPQRVRLPQHRYP